MFRNTLLKFFIMASLPAFMFCNREPGVLQIEKIQYGSVSGKIIHPDDNLLIWLATDYGIDSATLDPESQLFGFDSIRYGKCILQMMADGYGFFEQKIVIDKPQFICNDIVLARIPSQVSTIFPSNSQNLDSQFFSIPNAMITDTGFLVSISFNDIMDVASFDNAITILPDSVGVRIEWYHSTSLVLIFPYKKLSTIDTLRVSISSKVLNRWNDTLDHDFTVFYPVDTNFIRTARVE